MRVARRAVALCLTCALGACGRGNDRLAAGPIEVSDAWVRATNVTASGAMYGAFVNHADTTVQLLGVSTADARFAAVHETMEMSGMSHMQHLDSVAIAPRTTLTLKPGAMHVMLTDLLRPVSAGDTVTLTFRLGGGATSVVKAVVREP
jgi:periplasmic copper chaperone A